MFLYKLLVPLSDLLQTVMQRDLQEPIRME